jgi:glucose-6-phosphate 1-dehydrogenase
MNPQPSDVSATYEALREELGGAERPAFCLAIPPTSFETVVQQLGESGCARDARVIIEKPFGNDTLGSFLRHKPTLASLG